MKTFTKIEHLLEEQEMERKVSNLMSSSGAAFRTDAGARFFMGSVSRGNSASIKLSKYPYEWVEAVIVIKNLRH